MTIKKNTEKLIKKRKENHLCVACGNPLDQENRVTCSACISYIVQQTRMRRQYRYENGLCVECCAPMGRDDHKSCAACRAKHVEVMRKRAQ